MNDFSMRKIANNEQFRFQCNEDQPCYNRCCHEAVVPLTPYDALRLSENLELDSESFLKAFAAMNIMDDTGLPLPMLRMIESPDAPCPFLSPGGCSSYEDRPGACRSYPLGLAASLESTQDEDHYFLIEEKECCGQNCGQAWTAGEWLQNEGMEKYVHFNKLYANLAAAIREKNFRLDSRLGNMFFLCLYQPERFRDLIRKMNLFSRLNPGEEAKEQMMSTSSQASEALLEYAFKWLNFVLSGLDPQGNN